jgi:hypothetical protein
MTLQNGIILVLVGVGGLEILKSLLKLKFPFQLFVIFE